MVNPVASPTLADCGCTATVYADGSGIELHFCPLHKAGPQLLEALHDMVIIVDAYLALATILGTATPNEMAALAKARAAIAATQGGLT